jgi:hypothetical protein
MSALAPTLEAFFTQRLAAQRDASPHTVAAYRDTWRRMLLFAQDRVGKPPSQLDFADLDAALVTTFLTCESRQVSWPHPSSRILAPGCAAGAGYRGLGLNSGSPSLPPSRKVNRSRSTRS